MRGHEVGGGGGGEGGGWVWVRMAFGHDGVVVMVMCLPKLKVVEKNLTKDVKKIIFIRNRNGTSPDGGNLRLTLSYINRNVG